MRASEGWRVLDVVEIKPEGLDRGGSDTSRGRTWEYICGRMLRLELLGGRSRGRAERRFMDVGHEVSRCERRGFRGLEG